MRPLVRGLGLIGGVLLVVAAFVAWVGCALLAGAWAYGGYYWWAAGLGAAWLLATAYVIGLVAA